MPPTKRTRAAEDPEAADPSTSTASSQPDDPETYPEAPGRIVVGQETDQLTSDPSYDSVVAALVAVMRDVSHIAKDEQNTQQRYMFRGVDATMNVVGPVVRKHGLVAAPYSVEILSNEKYETRGRDGRPGSTMQGIILKVVWLLSTPGTTKTQMVTTLGQASDSGDKAVVKAFSVAFRELWLKLLVVPTGDKDVDQEEAHTRSTAPTTDPMVLAQFQQEIVAATQEGQLKNTWSTIDTAYRDGKLSGEDYNSLAQQIRRRLGELHQGAGAGNAGDSAGDEAGAGDYVSP